MHARKWDAVASSFVADSLLEELCGGTPTWLESGTRYERLALLFLDGTMHVHSRKECACKETST